MKKSPSASQIHDLPSPFNAILRRHLQHFDSELEHLVIHVQDILMTAIKYRGDDQLVIQFLDLMDSISRSIHKDIEDGIQQAQQLLLSEISPRYNIESGDDWNKQQAIKGATTIEGGASSTMRIVNVTKKFAPFKSTARPISSPREEVLPELDDQIKKPVSTLQSDPAGPHKPIQTSTNQPLSLPIVPKEQTEVQMDVVEKKHLHKKRPDDPQVMFESSDEHNTGQSSDSSSVLVFISGVYSTPYLTYRTFKFNDLRKLPELISIDISAICKLNKYMVLIGTENSSIILYDIIKNQTKNHHISKFAITVADKILKKDKIEIYDIKVDSTGKIIFADANLIYWIDITTLTVFKIADSYVSCKIE